MQKIEKQIFRIGKVLILLLLIYLTPLSKVYGSKLMHKFHPLKYGNFTKLEEVQKKIEAMKKDSALIHASWGILAVDLSNNKDLFSFGSEVCLTPASTQKLFTTGVGLSLLGSDYKYLTNFEYDGYIDSTQHILHGNFYVHGVGDPTIQSKFFKHFYRCTSSNDSNAFLSAILSVLKSKAIQKITGNIIADASTFEDEAISPNWIWEDLGNYFGAGSYGLNYKDNEYTVYLSSGEPGQITDIESIEPKINGLEISNSVTAFGTEDSAYIYGIPYLNQHWINGTIPPHSTHFEVRGAQPDPSLLCVSELKYFLQLQGVKVEGYSEVLRANKNNNWKNNNWENNNSKNSDGFKTDKPSYGVPIENSNPFSQSNQIDQASKQSTYQMAKRHLLGSWSSPPLSAIVDVTNHYSDNLFAETILKTLALQQANRCSGGLVSGSGSGASEGKGKDSKIAGNDSRGASIGSENGGIEAIYNYLKENKISSNGIELADGNGLSRKNSISCRHFVNFLAGMTKESCFKDFYTSIPSPGQPGTLLNFARGAQLKSKDVKLKSGSFKRVRSYAGYITLANGHQIALAFIANNFTCSSQEMRRKMEKVIESIANLDE